MKRLILITLIAGLLAGSGACNRHGHDNDITTSDIHNPATADGLSRKEAKNMPVITFEKTTHDFGKVIQGEKLSYTFTFTNTGKSNLIITSAEASCGCTTTTPPQAPIKPGEKGQIKVSFDSQNKKGPTKNMVIISANTYPIRTMIYITANVIVPNQK